MTLYESIKDIFLLIHKVEKRFTLSEISEGNSFIFIKSRYLALMTGYFAIICLVSLIIFLAHFSYVFYIDISSFYK